MKTTIQEHKSSSYTPRTYHNAQTADLTAAFATDFSTAGEKLTNKAAQEKYIRCDLRKEPIELARQLYKGCKAYHVRTLNIAGNGIYTFYKQSSYTQEDINKIIYDIVSKVQEYYPIEKIISGGQTGVDWAGGVAATALGIECIMTLPKGFKQRWKDGIDRDVSLQGLYMRLQLDVDKILEG